MLPACRAVLMGSALIGLLSPLWIALGEEPGVEHEARIRVSAEDDGWSVLVALLMSIPPGERSERLIEEHDVLGSGSIGPGEGRLLADTLGPETVGGFVLRADDSAVVPEAVEGTAASDDDGGIRVGLLLSYSLPSSVERLGVEVLKRPGGGKVEASPLLLTMELLENGESQVILEPTVKRPGDDATEISLSRLGEEEEGGDSSEPDVAPSLKDDTQPCPENSSTVFD